MKLECQVCGASELSNLKTDDTTLTDILYCDNCGLIKVEMNKVLGERK